MLHILQRSLIILATVLLSFTTYAQNSINGIVKSKYDDEALVGANVVLLPLSKGSTTNVSGQFTLDNIPNGEYQIKVSYVGFKTEERSITLTEDRSFFFFLEKDKLIGEEVVVSAIRADKLAPITQTTLTDQEIKSVFNGQDGAFVLEQLTPSIQVNSDAGTRFTNYGSMRLRGIDQGRINITLNGVPLNDMIDQGVFFSNFTDITRSMESVQVQRGVGTSTNGTASYAGSIGYESEDINTENPEATVTLLGGSFNTWQGTAEVKTGMMENNTAFYTRLSRTYSDGYRDHSGSDAYSFFFSGGWFGEKDIIKINGFNGRTKNDLAYSPVPESLIEEDPRTNVNNPNDIDDFGQSLLQLEHTHFFNENSTLTSSAYYGAAGGDFPFTYNVDSVTLASINYPLFNDHYGVMSYFNQKYTDIEWTTGVHAYRFNRENIEQMVPNFDNPYYQDQSIKDEISGFAKATYRIGDFSILGDIQARFVTLDMIPDTDFLGADRSIPTYDWTFINPKIGVTYEITPSLNAYASYGRSGREPTRSNYLGDTQINLGNIDSLQNQNLVQPEYVNDFETGVRFNTKKAKVNFNAFYMDFENEIAPIGEFIPQYFIQLYENQEASFRRGIELDWQLALVEKLQIRGNATYMQSIISEYSPEGSNEVFKDIKTPYSPEYFANITLQYQAFENFGASIHTRFVGKSYTTLTNDENFVLPSYSVTNVQLFSNIGQHYRVELDINNILSEQYYTDGGPVGNEMGYFVQAPAHFYATFIAKF
ncbi:iron complex outermembrane recepter protein [Marivirga sericea]|uniref:Iron complex outermembrane recepter protein n=1 Tax=Marivirga sericea TaxID=1028 RepID=A0A1X7JZW9_9BACT|nr:TonB-dependent receptor [Marivirga sericea]SMG34125.1 iron complex outermembrane recepter protein [Marivirga sericea]